MLYNMAMWIFRTLFPNRFSVYEAEEHHRLKEQARKADSTLRSLAGGDRTALIVERRPRYTVAQQRGLENNELAHRRVAARR